MIFQFYRRNSFRRVDGECRVLGSFNNLGTPVWSIEDAGHDTLPVTDVHVRWFEHLVRSALEGVDFIACGSLQMQGRLNPVEIVSGGEQSVLQLGNEYGFH